MNVWSNVVGSFVEAWQEIRIHRMRVTLSLIGVAVAVCAITTVVGLGAIAQQSTEEQIERSAGRPATLSLGVYGTGQKQPSAEDITAAFNDVVERYKIGYSSRHGYGTQRVQFSDGVGDVDARLVDEAYGAIHRVPMLHGSWLREEDARRFAPAIVINEAFYQRLGAPDLRTHPTVDLLGTGTTIAVIVGVVESPPYEDYPSMFMLPEAYAAIADPAELEFMVPQYELWVPPDMALQLTSLVQRDIAGALGDEFMVEVFRNDFGGQGEDPFLAIRIIISGVASLILFLGALGLVNIALVTVRQRVREIGIRRSFGATAGRIFFAVMMESVVATVAAGVVGVIGAVLIVQNPWVQGMLAQGLTDVPAFPVEAAVLGLVAATAVGAIAGLLPALVAVRVKVIDAIRF